MLQSWRLLALAALQSDAATRGVFDLFRKTQGMQLRNELPAGFSCAGGFAVRCSVICVVKVSIIARKCLGPLLLSLFDDVIAL